MVVHESDIQRRLHELFAPLVIAGLQNLHHPLEPYVLLKRSFGWRSDRTKRLDEALTRVATRIGSTFPRYKKPLEDLRDLMLVLADLERQHFWEWLGILIEELKREELITLE